LRDGYLDGHTQRDNVYREGHNFQCIKMDSYMDRQTIRYIARQINGWFSASLDVWIAELMDRQEGRQNIQGTEKQTETHTHTYVYIYIYIYIYIHTHQKMYILTYLHARAHIHRHKNHWVCPLSVILNN
jgi:hypothetical protein